MSKRGLIDLPPEWWHGLEGDNLTAAMDHAWITPAEICKALKWKPAKLVKHFRKGNLTAHGQKSPTGEFHSVAVRVSEFMRFVMENDEAYRAFMKNKPEPTP